MNPHLRILSGEVGSGKTTLAVKEMLGILRSGDGCVATNIELTDKFREVAGDRLCELTFDHLDLHGSLGGRFWEVTRPGSHIYLDEGTAHFDSRTSMARSKVLPELAKYLAHVRKYGDYVTVITQSVGHVDKRFRDLAGVFTYCVSLKQVLTRLGLNMRVFGEWFLVRDFVDPEYSLSAGWRLVRGGAYLWDYFDSYAVGTAGQLARLAAYQKGSEVVVGLGRRSWPWMVGGLVVALGVAFL